MYTVFFITRYHCASKLVYIKNICNLIISTPLLSKGINGILSFMQKKDKSTIRKEYFSIPNLMGYFRLLLAGIYLSVIMQIQKRIIIFQLVLLEFLCLPIF